MTILSTLFINLMSLSVIQLAPVEKAPIILPPIAPTEQVVAHSNYQPVLASWYGPGFHGNETASGETFDEYAMTVAHPYLPFGTQLEISYNDNTVIATVNDRGPYTDGREIDLSRGVAEMLGFEGVDTVYIRILNQ